jgi:hypothetical protein
MKSRKLRWAGHIVRIGETRNELEDVNGRGKLGELGSHGKIILKWILRK